MSRAIQRERHTMLARIGIVRALHRHELRDLWLDAARGAPLKMYVANYDPFDGDVRLIRRIRADSA